MKENGFRIKSGETTVVELSSGTITWTQTDLMPNSMINYAVEAFNN